MSIAEALDFVFSADKLAAHFIGTDQFTRIGPIDNLTADDIETNHLNITFLVQFILNTQQRMDDRYRNTRHALRILLARMAVHREEVCQSLAQSRVLLRLRVEVRDSQSFEEIWVPKGVEQHEFAGSDSTGGRYTRIGRLHCLQEHLVDGLE